MIKTDIHTLQDLDAAARALVAAFGSYRKIAISGEMGAGKTTLIQAICKVLGVTDIVNSPTFALINEYFTSGGESIFHFDLYRIEEVTEMYDFGYEDYFYSDDWCFIEWPEKAADLMPEDTLWLTITVREDGSRIVTG
ncbi:MAG: tRNA (adenosine(37)-N6)-threonylcarbamoyltransferase complex ATPase subunit type 1 TsaE [Bacteroidales bacterium]